MTPIRRTSCAALVFAALSTTSGAQNALRPPAVPLVACDPYFSIWSQADKLTDVATTHWTGTRQQLLSTVSVDGKTYRLMGTGAAPAFPQQSVKVTPTRSIYNFKGAGVAVTLTFMTPVLPDDIDILARPVTYLTWDVKATDGKAHRVRLGYGNTGEVVVDEPSQMVKWERVQVGELSGYKLGSVDQPILQKTGDARRIDWGHLYAVGGKGWTGERMPVGPDPTPTGLLLKPIAPASDPQIGWLHRDLGKIKAASAYVILAYDDLYGMQYFNENLRPYWRRGGMDAPGLLKASASEYAALAKRCVAFDGELTRDLKTSGGERYALLGALAYRQTWAGSKLVADKKGQPLLFPKENSSNGCVGTVDIIFPMAPQVLLFGPSLTKALLVSNLDYASSSYWKWPFAPHDLGQYPKANGQVYGGAERTEENQMPVEESGNMLILTLALAQMEGNADFAAKYWPTLTRWAEYLKQEGFDPANQLSTDDFMGHLAHQTNLSIKATLGIGAYAALAKMLGKPEAAGYEKIAHEFADRWVKEADDGDHFRLAFDQKGSWSQKYNLVWDKILDLGLYPEAVRRKEMAFYLKSANPFGVALDSRQGATPTKLDWSVWTATLTGDQKDFDGVMDGVWRFTNESPQRVPLSDWYNTKTGDHIGFIARPVVGGVFIKMLYDKPLWAKWAMTDTEKSASWAPLPRRPVVQPVVATGETEAATWTWVTKSPAKDWMAVEFNDALWTSGPGGIGAGGPPTLPVRSRWDTSEIWARRKFEFTGSTAGLHLRIYHDEDAEVYLNGVKIATLAGYTSTYDNIPLDAKARAALRQGTNVLAIHCRQTGGGQGIDAGFARVAR